MNMNFKPMNKFKYEPNLHEYEYEYPCQFMNHDKSNKLYEPTASFSSIKLKLQLWKKYLMYIVISLPVIHPMEKQKKNYFFTNNVGGPEPHLLPPLHNIENLTGKWVKIKLSQ